MNEGKVSVIIVHYRNPQNLLRCLDSLSLMEHKNFEVILVDNNSQNPGLGALEKKYGIKVIRSAENLGFAGGNNLGLERADGEFVLFLNDDTEVEKDLLTKLCARMETDKTIAALQPKIMLKDRPQMFDGVGSFPTITGFLNHVGLEEEDRGQYDHLQGIFSPKGSCLMVRKEVLDKVGSFDPDYFAYFEETDLAWRIWLAGYRIVFVPQARILHHRGATTRQLNFAFIQFHSNKNRWCSYLKNLAWFNLLWLLSLNVFLCILLAFVSLFRGGSQKSTAIFKALGWNIFNFGATIKKRRFVQGRLRKISDGKLFKPLLHRVPMVQYLRGLSWFVKERHLV